MQRDKIHRGRAESRRRIFLRRPGADVPERSARRAMFSQSRAAATMPQARASTGVDVGEKIFIGRAFVVVETQVHALAAGGHIAGGAMIHRDVVDESGSKIKGREQIILAGKIHAVMPGAMQTGVRRARRLKYNVFDRAETAVGKNTAVGVGDAQIARPAIGDAGKRDGVVTGFGEMQSKDFPRRTP